MLKEWDFLLAEIWVLLVVAALIGLFAGWLIWGARSGLGNTGPDAFEVQRLRAELERAQAQGRARLGDPLDDVPNMQGGGYSRPALKPAGAATPAPRVEKTDAKHAPVTAPAQPVGKPHALGAPRDGLPDDLTKIRGIGAKLEKLCNTMGFWHYDQIAGWSADEVAWVDDNLGEFKGRVKRNNWVEQAKSLAKNETPVIMPRKD